MTDQMQRLINDFSRVRVLVIGDVLLDVYMQGTPGRICREAPVPVVDLASRTQMPGGAANVAVNLRALGAQVRLVGVTGMDREGQQLRHRLEDLQVATDHLLAVEGRRTRTKNRVLASSQMLVRFDEGTVDELAPETEEQIMRNLPALYSSADVVIVSDYGCGTLTTKIIEAIGTLQRSDPRILAVDSRRRLSACKGIGATVVKPNYDEAIEFLGLEKGADSERRREVVAAFGEAILSQTGAQIAAVTMDGDGAMVFEKGCEPYRTYGVQATPSYAAGAGDTYLAAFALSLASGADTTAAAELGSAAAAVAVGKEGTTGCSQQELLGQVSFDGKYVRDLSRLVLRLDLYRRQGKRIVFTNGCFDILHRGHVTYLSRAKSSGDILVLGVNSDASVQKLKGPARPINTLEDRVQVLGALSCVDHIIAFDGETACDVVRVVRPDVYVKGGDYTKERLPEAPIVEQLGGEVRILPFLDNRSTTRIIERIRGENELAESDEMTQRPVA